MSLFTCPVCGAPLTKDSTYRCPSGHSFDISAAGHVNLLLANQKNSKAPGDDADMVKAREIFLSADYYAPLRDTLCNVIEELGKGQPLSLTDIGCGEGYYTEKIASLPNIRVAAFDISKPAAQKAAKRLKAKTSTASEVAVASAFSIPVADGGVNVALNVFSPLHLPEISRVLTEGGYFVYVVPSAEHLWELKSLIYDKPYKNEETTPEYEGFEYIEKRTVRGSIHLTSPDHVKALFTMTPYFWHTPKSFAARLNDVQTLDTKIGFDIHIYKKGIEHKA